MEPWTTKYRPSHIADCVLPPDLRDRLEGIVKQGQSPHLLFAGPPGVGKTTVALALCNDLGWRVWFKNASLHGRIENVRDEIAGFAQPDLSAFFGQQNQNCVVLDEADYLSGEAQAAMRNILDGARCPFVLTANWPDKLIEPIRSRCAIIEFDYAQDRAVMIAGYRARLKEILASEQVECAEEAAAALLDQCFPDFRQVLNELQSRIS
ncbi:MAG TPA: AAA family ATPase [Xanthobacteraceae bacterium]